jgi:hypothetical protein
MFSEYACKRMADNENFVISHIDPLETFELINDSIVLNIGNKTKDLPVQIKSSKQFFFKPILLPSAYAIQTHLFTGNLPACFRELRFLFEALAFCHYAEQQFPDESFFLNQVQKFEIFIKGKKTRKTISQLIENLECDTGIELKKVYGRLSNDWVHTRGFAEKVVDFTQRNSQMPSWAWILPITLNENDLSIINDLNQDVALFRALLEKTNDF